MLGLGVSFPVGDNIVIDLGARARFSIIDNNFKWYLIYNYEYDFSTYSVSGYMSVSWKFDYPVNEKTSSDPMAL